MSVRSVYKKGKLWPSLSLVILLSIFFIGLLNFSNTGSFESLTDDSRFSSDIVVSGSEGFDSLVSSGHGRSLVISDGSASEVVSASFSDGVVGGGVSGSENVTLQSSSVLVSGEGVVSGSETGFVSGVLGASAQSSGDDVFSSVWDTSKGAGDGVSLPLVSGGDYDFTVDWGDGNTSTVTSFNDVDKSHTYASGGVYTVNISGKIKGFSFSNGGDKDKFIRIENWGVLNLGNGGRYFQGASNFVDIKGVPDLTGMTNFDRMFENAVKFNGDVSGWNTENITNMNEVFRSARGFNRDITGWDVSSVTTMRFMFSQHWYFNQDIGGWDVGSVTDMTRLFAYSGMKQDLTSWRVCQVTSRASFDSGSGYSHLPEKHPKFDHPCVRSVGFEGSSVGYTVGDVLTLKVNFNENVVVTGTPKLELNFSGVLRNASYSSGSGGKNLAFTYTVQSSDESSDLDYSGVGSLFLDGGGIVASDDSKTAVLTLPKKRSLSYSYDVVVNGSDTVAPVVSDFSVGHSIVGESLVTGDSTPLVAFRVVDRHGVANVSLSVDGGVVSVVDADGSVDRVYSYDVS